MATYEQLIEQAQQEQSVAGQEERAAWTDSPLTKSLRLYLRAQEELLKEKWAAGDYTGEQAYDTIQMNSQSIGHTQAYMDVLDVLEQLKSGEEL